MSRKGGDVDSTTSAVAWTYFLLRGIGMEVVDCGTGLPTRIL
jgi:hypothetical protein